MINHFQNCKGKKESISTETTIPNSEEKSLYAETFLHGSKKVENWTYTFWIFAMWLSFFRSPFMQRQAFMGEKRSPFMQRNSFMKSSKRSPFAQRLNFMG